MHLFLSFLFVLSHYVDDVELDTLSLEAFQLHFDLIFCVTSMTFQRIQPKFQLFFRKLGL